MTSAQDSVFLAVGQAVAAAQTFESAFVVIARAMLKGQTAETLEELIYMPITAFKQPTKSVLRQLCALGLDPRLEARITNLVEARHTVVHRLFLQSGWPGPVSADAEAAIVTLCSRVTAESLVLTVDIISALRDWLVQFPQYASEVSEKAQGLDQVAEGILLHHRRVFA